MIAAVVAVDNNWGIGYNGDLLVNIPDDLRHFRQLTSGSMVVMGRKTWDSLPKKPLPNRTNIVISNQGTTSLHKDAMRMSLDDLLLVINDIQYDVFVIGGGEIYKQLLPYCDRVYVTKILKDFENVDTYFPNLDKSSEWAPAMMSQVYYYKDLAYQFWEYDSI